MRVLRFVMINSERKYNTSYLWKGVNPSFKKRLLIVACQEHKALEFWCRIEWKHVQSCCTRCAHSGNKVPRYEQQTRLSSINDNACLYFILFSINISPFITIVRVNYLSVSYICCTGFAERRVERIEPHVRTRPVRASSSPFPPWYPHLRRLKTAKCSELRNWPPAMETVPEKDFGEAGWAYVGGGVAANRMAEWWDHCKLVGFTQGAEGSGHWMVPAPTKKSATKVGEWGGPPWPKPRGVAWRMIRFMDDRKIYPLFFLENTKN